MTITQTVTIPENHKLVIDVPREVPAGPVVLAFTPAEERKYELPDEDGLNYEGDCPICAKYSDPKTGALIPNAETIASFEEGKAMKRGEIPAKRFHSFEDMWADLMRDDPDD